MGTIYGTYHDGRVELDSPVDWPEGIRVGIVELGEGSTEQAEVDWPDDTSEEREQRLALLDSIEPLRFTPEDEAEIAAARAEVREVTLRAFNKKMWCE